MPIEHTFTPTILSILVNEYGEENAASSSITIKLRQR